MKFRQDNQKKKVFTIFFNLLHHSFERAKDVALNFSG